MPNRGKFIGNDNLYVPDAPTIGTATADDGSISITFTAPSDVGNDAITGFIATAFTGSTAIGATGTSSPIEITGLTNGSNYTIAVSAVNDYGTGPLSSASSSVSPLAPRAILGGGRISGSLINVIQYVAIASNANASDFGDLTLTREMLTAAGNKTRSLFIGGTT
jgi:hypothetical protein